MCRGPASCTLPGASVPHRPQLCTPLHVLGNMYKIIYNLLKVEIFIFLPFLLSTEKSGPPLPRFCRGVTVGSHLQPLLPSEQAAFCYSVPVGCGGTSAPLASLCSPQALPSQRAALGLANSHPGSSLTSDPGPSLQSSNQERGGHQLGAGRQQVHAEQGSGCLLTSEEGSPGPPG